GTGPVPAPGLLAWPAGARWEWTCGLPSRQEADLAPAIGPGEGHRGVVVARVDRPAARGIHVTPEAEHAVSLPRGHPVRGNQDVERVLGAQLMRHRRGAAVVNDVIGPAVLQLDGQPPAGAAVHRRE